jgi:hypothetical protein
MSKPYAPSPRFNAAGVTTGSVLALIVAMAASVPLTAHAEYRCGSPSTPEDARACELVKRAAPDELRLFVQRTTSIYGLDFNDYVTSADVDRWQAARLEDRSTSVAAAAPTEPTSEEQRN